MFSHWLAPKHALFARTLGRVTVSIEFKYYYFQCYLGADGGGGVQDVKGAAEGGGECEAAVGVSKNPKVIGMSLKPPRRQKNKAEGQRGEGGSR